MEGHTFSINIITKILLQDYFPVNEGIPIKYFSISP